ncbi:hypothetical protein G9A89_007331 [Geosiphon pyriformis]|nr:hypothetical protein G9A89_007331 [Geosiphon pyriformis]
MEGKDVEQTSKPSKQTKSNILPATITKDTTLAAYVSKTTKNGLLPPNTTANLVYWTDLGDQNDKINGTIHHALSVTKSCQMKNSGMMYLAEKRHVMKHVNILS